MVRVRWLLAMVWMAALAGCARKASTSAIPASSNPAAIRVTVDGDGYHPPSVSAPAGRPVTLSFVRISDEGCGQQVVFPSLNLRRDLPLNHPVDITVTAPASGTLAFTCGMGMFHGAITVR